MNDLLIFKLREPNRIGGKLMIEAADALEALRQELDAAKKSEVERLLRIEVKVDELIAERDALKAELAALKDQKPVGHIYTIAGVQHCTIEQVLDDCALFAAPGANHG